ncbi:DUF6888 family protein [Laspinema palackyanum]|uniref:DUF6888 family protein n=1 Tax=Laspinema palackyanum TaxID=3231601 RepID=UPI003F541BB6
MTDDDLGFIRHEFSLALFRYNPQKGYVYILAGDDLEVIVTSSGEWRFIYESEI